MSEGKDKKFSTTLLVDWTAVNGVIRAVVTTHSGLYAYTNAYKNDFYFVSVKQSNYYPGMYQAKINHPKVSTNWKFIFETMGTNYINSFPGNNSAWSNLVMTSYTQAFHNVITAQIATATNGMNGTNYNTKVRLNTNINRLMVATNTLGTNLRIRLNTGSANLILGTNTLGTNLRVRLNTGAANLILGTNTLGTNLRVRINTVNARATWLTNNVLLLSYTNAYSIGNFTHATQLSHWNYTNVLNLHRTNRIQVKAVDNFSNYVIYVSNGAVKTHNATH
jgi:cell division protein FtsL